jgi:TetR/AcrR family transcriptional regulator, repressor for neighboring sulfatase
MRAGLRQSRGISTARKRSAVRRRRSAAETRVAILDAAERRLLEGGPDAIRLQEIAADAGISHPAILHHFGSREGLVEAMVLRGIAGLQAQFLAGWPSAKEPDIEGVLERFYEVASHRGMARMLAWLILSGQSYRTMKPDLLKPAAERMHAGRVRRAQRDGRRPPELEDSLFAATHLFILVLGDSLFGASIRRAMGLGSGADSTRRFRRWLSKVIERMASPDPAAGLRAPHPRQG